MPLLNTKKMIYTLFFITFSASAWAAISNVTPPKMTPLVDSSDPIKTNSDIALSATSFADNPFIFQAGNINATSSTSSTWTGTLQKKAINHRSNGSVVIAQEVQWDAGKLLTEQHLPNKRVIVTYNHENKQTVAFEMGQLPDAIYALFNRSPDTLLYDNLGAKRVSYLKGERAMERTQASTTTPQFSARNSVLGSIGHSAPVYVGAPTKHITDADYLAFYNQYKTRPGTVFVGANDGMLHGFSADSGTELFAYIPSPLISKLPRLTSPNYLQEITMDGNSHVAEARVANKWKTVLTAGMGKGAKGVFALDITKPDQFMHGSRALFEFTENDDPDIGYITAPPFIVKITTGKNKNSSGLNQHKDGYYIAVTSGHDATDIDNKSRHNGEHFLFLLSLDKSPIVPWSKNSNYYKIAINSHNNSTPNALSPPGFLLNKHGAIRYAYAGDLQGNLWRFDFTGDKPASIKPNIIFAAKDNDNNPQPITAQPVISSAPDGGNLILFGTGNAIKKPGGINNQNSFYAIHDNTKNRSFRANRSQLAARELVPITSNEKAGYKVTGKPLTYATYATYATSSSDKKGWYIDYMHTATNKNCKEQNVSEGLLAYGMIFFNTVTPTGSLCNAMGTSTSYKVNAVTGLSELSDVATNLDGFISHAGLVGSPILIITKTSLGERDSFGRRYNTQHYSVLNFGTHGTSDASKATLTAGRLSWREISNWRDLKMKR